MDQDVAAPSVLDRRAQIPLKRGLALYPVAKNHVLAPRQLCSNLPRN